MEVGNAMRMKGLLIGAMMAMQLQPAAPQGVPKMIAYSVQPNTYFKERAADIARIYDGFFFTIGSWDEGVTDNLGLPPDVAPSTTWKEQARDNLAHLRAAGVTENLLGVHFGQSAPWPSPETLLSDEYRQKFRRHFGALGKAAKELGFRGVSIDVEYPYPRYSLDHEIYTYESYTAEDLLTAAAEQGRTAMEALLAEFPESVVFVLPGEIRGRPIERAFVLSMLHVMAEKDAPGGFHLGYERAYSLHEPAMVSQVAIPRVGDCMVSILGDDLVRAYWKRRCTVAPGVWPLHMVETGGEGYPVRPWPEELAELRRQMEILRSVAKRYTWSFSGAPVWYLHTPEIEEAYGLTRQNFVGAEEAITGWHRILSGHRQTDDPRIARLIDVVARFDRGEIGCAELCSRLGTPGEWLILGPLGNPFTHPAYSAPNALFQPIGNEPVHGRDGAVRWFVFHSYEPLGSVRLQAAFDWRATDDCAAHAVCTIRAPREIEGFLWLNWDDGAAVWINDELVFDHRTYPPEGHGLLFRDRYLFEERVAVSIPQGESRLAVTCINSHGAWGFNMRFTDADGFPLDDVTFGLPEH